MNVNIALASIAVSLIGTIFLFVVKDKSSRWLRKHRLYPMGRIVVVLWGLSLLLLGRYFYQTTLPLASFLSALFAVLGVQVSLWAIGISLQILGNAPDTIEIAPERSFRHRALKDSSGGLQKHHSQVHMEVDGVATRVSEGGVMGLIKKWYHPLYFVLLLVLGGLIGHKIKIWSDLGPQDPAHPELLLHTEPWMLITALTIMLLVILKDRIFETKAIRTLEDITATSQQNWTNLTNWITNRLTPTIISFDSTHKVLEQASNIINAAIVEPSDEEKYVIFAGSAALYRDLPDEESERDTPITQYRTAMARLSSNSIPVVRYISLLEPLDYKRRGRQTKADYISWLEKQISLIERNPHYSLFNCPRAPTWGSSRSSIFTARAVLDIVGNGLSGILIRGDQVAQDLKNSSKELFEHKAVVPPEVCDKPSLLKYIKTLERSDPETLAAEPAE